MQLCIVFPLKLALFGAGAGWQDGVPESPFFSPSVVLLSLRGSMAAASRRAMASPFCREFKRVFWLYFTSVPPASSPENVWVSTVCSPSFEAFHFFFFFLNVINFSLFICILLPYLAFGWLPPRFLFVNIFVCFVVSGKGNLAI